LELLFIIIFIVVIAFGFVLIFGAPYLPSLTKQINIAFDMVNLQPGSKIIELGCGDGKVLIAAAKKGFCAIGYELNPILFMVAWLRTIKYHRQVKVVWGNFWYKSWPEADAIYVFLLPRFMNKLERAIETKCTNSIKVVSFAFNFNNRQPTLEKEGVFLYEFTNKKVV